jgi:hypothetical protein
MNRLYWLDATGNEGCNGMLDASKYPHEKAIDTDIEMLGRVRSNTIQKVGPTTISVRAKTVWNGIKNLPLWACLNARQCPSGWLFG